MKLIQIKINLQGEIAIRDIHVEEKSISKLAGTHRIVLPAIHDNILNRKYVEKKWINRKLEKAGYDILILCEPDRLGECMNLAKEERKKLLETVLIPQAKASLYAYEIELDKINKAEEIPVEETPKPVEEAPKEEVAPVEEAPVETAPKKRGRKKAEAEAPVEKVETPVEEVPAEEAPAPVEKPVAKRRGRVEKKAVEEVPTPKQYEEMTLAELKQECAKLGIVPASRNKEKIIAQLRGE